MASDAQDFAVLSTDKVQLVLAVALGARPEILHWGALLEGATPADLVRLTRRQRAFGGPDEVLSPSLSNELGIGSDGPSGFLAHRGGKDWAALFSVVAVEQEGPTRVTVRCEDKNVGIRINYAFDLSPLSHVLVVRTVVENIASDPLSLDWCTALCMPLDDRLTKVRTYTGRWAGEFSAQSYDLTHGSFVRENKSGRTSHDNFPGLILHSPTTEENSGPCAGLHLGWSGNSRLRVDGHSDGRTFAQAGELFFPGEMVLPSGEDYAAPPLFMAWSDDGMSGVSRMFHAHVRAHILDGRTAGRPRLVHFNTWEAVYFDHDEERLLALAERAAEVGAERFVLDDGWFGARRHDGAGLGDWHVSKEVYPEGLHKIVTRVRDLGMQFGIWFEPEMVNPDSDLFREHPDWILSAADVDQVPSRRQYVLDLTRAELADRLFRQISDIVSEYDVDYIKWDMNRNVQHPGDGRGRAAAHRQVKAVYALMARLRAAHPSLEIESCSSGGGRMDFGVLRYTDRLWTSDTNDALDRQSIQAGASQFFPLEVLGCHVGPKECHITGRVLPMPFRAATAIFGHMGLEVDLLKEAPADLQCLKAAIDLYKRHRDVLHSGSHYRLEMPEGMVASGVVAVAKDEALYSCAKVGHHRATLPGRMRFSGLDESRSYRVRMIWPLENVSLTEGSVVDMCDLMGGGSVFSGALLSRCGMQLPLMHPQTCLLFHLTAEKVS